MDMKQMEQDFDPFSPGNALKAWKNNHERTALLLAALEEGIESKEDGRSLLYKAVEAIGRMTDNSILLQVVSRSLEKPEGNLHSGEMSS